MKVLSKARKTAFYKKAYNNRRVVKFLRDEFHKLYFYHGHPSPVWMNTSWLGIGVTKCPQDLWLYQEILVETKPSTIIELGTLLGGSALFLACVCDLIGTGQVITVDIQERPDRPVHPRITYITGSSTDAETVNRIRNSIQEPGTTLVILDSDHAKKHVLKELEIYSQFVTKDSFLIVEDTQLNGYPVVPTHGAGPMEAVEEFLSTNKKFVRDATKEKFLMTFNPKGFLKKLE
jgi:cephalosporin hydroxylase